LTVKVTPLKTDCLNDGRHRQGNLSLFLKIFSSTEIWIFRDSFLALLKKPLLTAKIAKNAKKIDAEPQILKRIARLGQDCSYSH